MKAARALRGLSVPALSGLLGEGGLGERTLRTLEADSGRPFRQMEIRAIARACRLPYEFFTIDFAVLGHGRPVETRTAESSRDDLETRVSELEARMAAVEQGGPHA